MDALERIKTAIANFKRYFGFAAQNRLIPVSLSDLEHLLRLAEKGAQQEQFEKQLGDL